MYKRNSRQQVQRRLSRFKRKGFSIKKFDHAWFVYDQAGQEVFSAIGCTRGYLICGEGV